ncbi:aryl-alcohol dehydrogenase-like predicted oxidoreductase [Thermocatellispora tengchongensis]|uniref:Aryl-alcohol dehydrogenase-like predicted oxidoreductase n=1 Tax=Thermocatellispora tengchongensis TaxID=1073253 RepID=A0A840PBX4_9ACTN|nr:aldo/keto reductase [Thermocatellispora tengchongensis]MBB5138914.1 aryl-alcohol dehydrogenase-like predicted oxidoreductase [Thermocatellispora tengchongensis]
MTRLPIALGTIPFGTTVDERTSFAILDRFAEAGGTMLDTANNYPFWNEGRTGDESEATLGAWLASRGNRDAMVLGTKCGARPTVPGDRTLDSAEGLSARVIREAAQGSLRRLRTDRIDVYWAHIEDRSVPLEETLGAFGELVREGVVREIGASNIPTWRLERARALSRANGWAPYTHLQLRHTYLRPRPWVRLPEAGHTLVSDEALDYVRSEPDLTLWAYNTLMFGAYTRPDRPIQEIFDHPGTTRRMAVLREVAGELGATPNQVVLAWLIGGDPAIVPIVGVSTLEQLEEMIAAADLKLEEDQRARLDAAS